jgi:hypothetical protein
MRGAGHGLGDGGVSVVQDVHHAHEGGAECYAGGDAVVLGVLILLRRGNLQHALLADRIEGVVREDLVPGPMALSGFSTRGARTDAFLCVQGTESARVPERLFFWAWLDAFVPIQLVEAATKVPMVLLYDSAVCTSEWELPQMCR